MPQLTWLVTGTSSGLGEQLVHSILACGDRVIATARRADERLGHLEKAGAAIMELDVTAPPSKLQVIIEQAVLARGGIDVLVNNAGYIEASMVEELEYERPSQMSKDSRFG